MVGIYWNNHHHLLRATDQTDGTVMWSNLFLLFWLSLLPIVTAWVGRYPRHTLPALLFGVVGLGAGAAYSLLVRRIIRVDGTGLRRRAVRSASDTKGYLSLALYAAGVGWPS